jgi:transglutaminase-like putative cysteine protease
MVRAVSLILPLLVTIGASGAPVGRIDPKNPPHGRFSDEWAEVFMAGGKVGYLHATMNRNGDIIRTESVTRIKLGRLDSPVVIEMRQHAEETLGGVPIRFGSEMNAASIKTATNGTVADERVTIVTSQYGMDQTQSFDYPKGAVMAWGQFREGLLRGFKPGTQYATDVYAPELRLDGAVVAKTKIGEWEEFTHQGKQRKGQRITVEMVSPIGSLELTSWVNEFGWPIKAKIPAPGLGDMLIWTTDQASALKDFLPPEIFMATTIKAKRSIDAKSASRISYRVKTIKSDVELADFPTTPMQTSKRMPDGSIELSVKRLIHKQGAPRGAGDEPLTQEQLAEFLDSNLMINTSDPELIKLAKQAGGQERDPFMLADRLRRFVSNYVTTETLGIGFATASEVCRTRAGDCSEYGVLLAALGRINKLPSRVVAGLAYVPLFGNESDIFGYHMWTQFYIDGRWVDFDAALRESVCSPARIAFATSSLKHAGLADLSLPLISKIGAIDIDVLKVE